MPGFSSFKMDDQHTMLRERWLEGWLMAHYCQIQGYNFYQLNDPLRVHGSTYWTQQFLDPEQIRTFFLYGAALNKLHLSQVEAFLLYALGSQHVHSRIHQCSRWAKAVAFALALPRLLASRHPVQRPFAFSHRKTERP
ncbi:hypothetical protein RvY_06951-1 [Ramazzottius varieornatus]|uniref:Uncharacterized protein n=1 Tax=Ramazzottius varieornatus TaxID=947166 RepID=A0A1D1V0E5_RAMVA|nr:hypothetical protein RvY_06951-1 [Ramazzottius varieornatus]